MLVVHLILFMSSNSFLQGAIFCLHSEKGPLIDKQQFMLTLAPSDKQLTFALC